MKKSLVCILFVFPSLFSQAEGNGSRSGDGRYYCCVGTSSRYMKICTRYKDCKGYDYQFGYKPLYGEYKLWTDYDTIPDGYDPNLQSFSSPETCDANCPPAVETKKERAEKAKNISVCCKTTAAVVPFFKRSCELQSECQGVATKVYPLRFDCRVDEAADEREGQPIRCVDDPIPTSAPIPVVTPEPIGCCPINFNFSQNGRCLTEAQCKAFFRATPAPDDPHPLPQPAWVNLNGDSCRYYDDKTDPTNVLKANCKSYHFLCCRQIIDGRVVKAVKMTDDACIKLSKKDVTWKEVTVPIPGDPATTYLPTDEERRQRINSYTSTDPDGKAIPAYYMPNACKPDPTPTPTVAPVASGGAPSHLPPITSVSIPIGSGTVTVAGSSSTSDASPRRNKCCWSDFGILGVASVCKPPDGSCFFYGNEEAQDCTLEHSCKVLESH